MSAKKPPTFQDVLLGLQEFWAKQGCIVWQPHHTEVGAGTFNPATFLKVLGPDPWKVAYVEPSIRPTDGRYGENPYRLGHYYQYQVILKPCPDNVQDLYLASLEHLGIDLSKHDVRFVEDDWESPTLGRLGPGLGGLDRRHGVHAVHVLSAGGRHRSEPHQRGAHLWH